jgi:hypothetical protein
MAINQQIENDYSPEMQSRAEKSFCFMKKNHGWYDFQRNIKKTAFPKRYAGRIETGNHGKTDP